MAKFAIGDVVRRIAAPDQVGAVREVWQSDQTAEWLCRVQFGLQRQTVPERALELLPDSIDPWSDLANGRLADASAFHQLLTFERISRPASRVAASFGTAKAKLLPYQFKPLLKFIENSSQRLLIADDVGLGKTVEAGYIFKELKARHGVDRCLIVVPARLRTKWKYEFANRFDEDFQIVNARTIREQLFDRLASGSEPERALWITSYESLRQPAVVDGFAELQPTFDLVVLDEAHRVRNSETEQHRAARALAACADAMVFLSATPVQTHIENLYQLLSLLEPTSFSDFPTFQRLLQANEHVVRALRLIRRGGVSLNEAGAELEALTGNPLTASLAKEDFFRSLLHRLRSESTDRTTLVELQRDVAELSLTSHVLSRTRKVDVLPDRPERRPNAVVVKLSQEERQFYYAVAQLFVTQRLASNWGNAMALLMALRLTASCMPAAARYFQSKGMLNVGAEEFDDSEDEQQLTENGSVLEIGSIAFRLPSVDSKFAAFTEALQAIWTDDANAGRPFRKVIVFAFFRGTLDYLSEQLTKEQIAHRLIHGRIPQAEREIHIADFVNDPNILVLLSSEVGSEGVDLQVASVIVNYDLPWNPMMVEQRIGRADRLGQQSKVINIVNLVLENTVEDRILLRLYNRIDLFRNSIGELEPILGDRIERLAVEQLKGELSADELEKRVDNEALALEHQLQNANRLQSEADTLLAGDQAFLDEVEGLIGFRKVPASIELFRFLSLFLDRRYPGCRFDGAVLSKPTLIELRPEISAHLINRFPGDSDVRRVAATISQGPFSATFDSDAYLRIGRAEFISMHHPLIRLACADFEKSANEVHRAFQLSVRQLEKLMPGVYVLAILELEVTGVRPRTEIVPLAVQVGSTEQLPKDETWSLYIASLDNGSSVDDFNNVSQEPLQSALNILKHASDVSRAQLRESESTLGALRAARRRATQEGTLRQKVTAAKARYQSLRMSESEEFVLRMAEGRQRKAEALLEAFLRDAGPTSSADVQVRDVAIALIKVVGR